MILCIAEKPSVGREIARVLKARNVQEGYIEGNGYVITWAIGHLCCLKEPEDYDPTLRHWDMNHLPILPARFQIKVIETPAAIKQFAIIKRLIGRASEVINCGDAGQEGELIQRFILQQAGCQKPVRRLWISSLTEQAIRDGFDSLRPAADFDLLYHAGLCRAIGDWLLGMNGTRAYTLRCGRERETLSIGRVQTPTLAMIVARCRERDNFTPEAFWELNTFYRNVLFHSKLDRFKTEDEARTVLNRIAGRMLTINKVNKKDDLEYSPKLFDLTLLQEECNLRFGFTADYTLAIAQTLYESGLITYPRTDTSYLPTDVKEKLGTIFCTLAKSKAIAPDLADQMNRLTASRIAKSSRVFNDEKVTDHHAIIPTGKNPETLSVDSNKVYDLIVRRTVANFMTPAKWHKTEIEAAVDLETEAPVGFRATGRKMIEPGWRALFPRDPLKGPTYITAKQAKDEQDELQQLPEMTEGEQGEHIPEIRAGKTHAPKYYTEATLLRAMQTAGRQVDDAELSEAMKENGIGRPSTRAAIIELLIKRRYIVRVRKSIKATELGCRLIDTVNDPLLCSPTMTGQWEKKLRQIEQGEYPAQQFISELKTLATTVVQHAMNTPRPEPIPEQPKPEPQKRRFESRPTPQPVANITAYYEGMPCPMCGRGVIIRGNTMFGCSRWKEGCQFRAPFPDDDNF